MRIWKLQGGEICYEINVGEAWFEIFRDLGEQVFGRDRNETVIFRRLRFFWGYFIWGYVGFS